MERNGAAIVLNDSELERLLPLVGELLHDDARLRTMKEASRRLARPNAAGRIAAILLELAGEARA